MDAGHDGQQGCKSSPENAMAALILIALRGGFRPSSSGLLSCYRMIQKVLVLGSGSAGLIAALSLKKKLPRLKVRIVRSPEIGVIGVGEGTTPNFPRHLFEYLGIPKQRFYELAEPTWKLGIRFLWGTRKRFDYTFNNQLDLHRTDLPMPNGFYCDGDFSYVDVPSSLMRTGKVFTRLPDGSPDIQPWHAFHVENWKFVQMLETVAREAGVEILDGKVTGSVRGPQGIASVHLEDGQSLEADLFVDCSGFQSELLGRTLEEPFEGFGKTLFCDRAVVGGWERRTNPSCPTRPLSRWTRAGRGRLSMNTM